MTTITQATAGQIEQINRFGSDAIRKVLNELGLDGLGAQRVIEHGGEFVEAIRNTALASLKDLSVSDKFKDEEVSSSYGYLSGYTPKGLTEQCNRLRELFSGIGYANLDLLAQIEAGKAELPANAEGWFAIPNIWKKGGQPKIGSTYSECVQKILDTIKETRGRLYNYREGSIDEKHLRQLVTSKEMFEKISEEQGNPDILIISAQFGLRHRGRSVRRARVVMASGEFGLGAFAIGCMLLTHPERLEQSDDLWIDCTGDEFAPDDDGRFSDAPFFNFYGDEVEFGSDFVSNADDDCGSASAFFPQK